MNPALGRFITPDPVRDFLNPYSYVRNNPVNGIDPTGMAWSPPVGYSHGPAQWLFGTVKPISDEEMFFDTASERDIIAYLLRKAIDAADDMASKSGVREERQAWIAIGTALYWILLNDAFQIGDTDDERGLASWKSNWGEDGALVGGTLTVDPSFFHQHPEVQIGVLLHEGAHRLFGERTGRISKEYKGKYEDEIAVGLTRYDSEEFAWSYTIKYFDTKLTQNTTGTSHWGHNVAKHARIYGLERTIYSILANSKTLAYAELWFLYGPKGYYRNYGP